ncbi:MAG: SLC26A/SulP transporter family protein [Terriglobales bacterium]
MSEPVVGTARRSEPATVPPDERGRQPAVAAGEFWGGLAAMLVALPSAIAFGVAIYAPLGAGYASHGAIAGILGTTALGIIAASFGGTRRLITAPSAPAVAVMSAFAIELTQRGVAPSSALLLLAMTTALCGILQVSFGLFGFGQLIKYMPYPVVSGYLSGVGLIIILSQIPKFLGVPGRYHFWEGLLSPAVWKWQSIAVGVVSVAVMVLAPWVTKRIPAAILALTSGTAAYFALALADRSLLVLAGNRLVVGPLRDASAGLLASIAGQWHAFSALDPRQLGVVITPALTLAVLLSIDTLKTCVILDSLTRSRHDSNRELIGQGLGNLTSMAIGGVPGSGQMGATLVNLASGGQTHWSGVIEGVLALAAFLVLGNLIAWIPIAALAGILIVVGTRMFDLNSLSLLRSRSTVLDFVVIVTVVVVAETVGLIAASGVGIGLAILLFLRELIGGTVVRRKAYGNERFSRQMRLPEEMEVLVSRGNRTVIFELQGSLFFGTTDQLYSELELEVKQRDYVVLDMRRVQSVDITAAHMLELVEDMMSERKGTVIYSHMPDKVPGGQDMQQYFDEVGLVRTEHHARVFEHLDDALEWIENRILAEAKLESPQEPPLEIRDMAMFQQRREETLAALEAGTERRAFRAGERIFAHGDRSDELYFIRQGSVRILLPLDGRTGHHLATFGRGDFFGELSFLDQAPRSADAVALTDVELYVLSRARFDQLSAQHRMLALNLLQGIATAVASRLRRTDVELRYLKES